MCRKHSVVKPYPKATFEGKLYFVCLFRPSPTFDYTSQSIIYIYIYNTILYNTSPFILSKAYTRSGIALWSGQYLQALGATEEWVYFREWRAEVKDKVGKYTGPSFSSRGRSGLKNPGGVTLGNTQWRQAWLLSRGTNLVGIRGKSLSEIRQNMLQVVWLNTTPRRRVWYGNGRLFSLFFPPTVETRGLIAWSKDPLEIKREG